MTDANAEQDYVDSLFAKLDDEVAAAQHRLAEVQLQVDPANPDAEALLQRETEYHSLNERIDRLNIAQLGLVFGRIDVECDNEQYIDNPVPGLENVDRRYIGRMGLDDRDDDYRTLLLDWRAPLARPFYLATIARPEGVLLRRHIRTKGRKVTGVDDEVLSGMAEQEPKSGSDLGVASESALFKAMQAARTGHMASIVETIQREQDEIIRDETRGVMVVVGGPGTGKTAVALHRVAFLLYTWRDYLARTGVLIIGPNRTFLDYISRVLPELGETGVVLSTIGELYPGIIGDAPEPLLVQEVKGSAEMVTILDRAVKSYQKLPESRMHIKIDGIELAITAALVKGARTRARRTRRPHNEAQAVFKDAFVERLTTQLVKKIGADPLGGTNLLSAADHAQLHDDLAEEPQIAELVEQFWPQLTPPHVLADLLGSQEFIAQVAFDYDEETQQALWRAEPTAWSSSDAALLDELAQLIGIADTETDDQLWQSQVEDAQETLDTLSSSAHSDLDDESEAEILSAFDVVDAEELARRQEIRDHRSTAQRARADLEWTYGHVIIDEAQELSPMEWRMVMRRCPSRWMTIVGDTAQTGSPAGVDSWSETLDPFVAQRFKTHQLSVNYRTPKEIMEVANEVLMQFAPSIAPSTSLRTASADAVTYYPSGTDPVTVATQLESEHPERLTAVIAADSAVQPGMMGVSSIKGLEFDHVVVANPEEIIADSPQGYQNLFVALTRATQSLHIIGKL